MSVSHRKLIRLILELPYQVHAAELGQEADRRVELLEHEQIEEVGRIVEPKAIQNAFVSEALREEVKHDQKLDCRG